jgi:hypothetical protein
VKDVDTQHHGGWQNDRSRYRVNRRTNYKYLFWVIDFQRCVHLNPRGSTLVAEHRCARAGSPSQIASIPRANQPLVCENSRAQPTRREKVSQAQCQIESSLIHGSNQIHSTRFSYRDRWVSSAG